MRSGLLSSKRASLDLLEDLDLTFLQQAGLDTALSSSNSNHTGSSSSNSSGGGGEKPGPNSGISGGSTGGSGDQGGGAATFGNLGLVECAVNSAPAGAPSSSCHNGLRKIPSETGSLAGSSSLESFSLGGLSNHARQRGGGNGGNNHPLHHGHSSNSEFNLDDINFDGSDEECTGPRGRSCSVSSVNSMVGGAIGASPSLLGRTPTDVFSGTFEEAHSLRIQSSRSGQPANNSSSSSSGGKHGLLLSSSSSSSNSSRSRHTITIPTSSAGGGGSGKPHAKEPSAHGPRRRRSASGPGPPSRSSTPDLSLGQFGGAFAGFDALADAATVRLDDEEGRIGLMVGSDDDERPYGYDDDDEHARAFGSSSFLHGGQSSGDERPAGYVGAYSPEARRQRVQRFLEKRQRRVWTKKQVKYDVRKNFADSRMRVKGRFVKKEDEELLRDLMSMA